MKENVKKFAEALSGDAALREALQAEVKKAGSKDEAVKIAIEFAAAHGFEFTAADLKEQKAELSEDELAAVSGGVGCGCAFVGYGESRDCVCVLTGNGYKSDCYLIGAGL